MGLPRKKSVDREKNLERAAFSPIEKIGDLEVGGRLENCNLGEHSESEPIHYDLDRLSAQKISLGQKTGSPILGRRRHLSFRAVCRRIHPITFDWTSALCLFVCLLDNSIYKAGLD